MIVTETFLETVEEFDLVPPCEHSQHYRHYDSSTKYLIRAGCPKGCDGKGVVLYLCDFAWSSYRLIQCTDCFFVSDRDAFWTMLSEV